MKSFHLLEVAYMKSSVQLPVGKKSYQSLVYGAKSYVIKLCSGKRMPKESKHPRRMQMQIF